MLSSEIQALLAAEIETARQTVRHKNSSHTWPALCCCLSERLVGSTKYTSLWESSNSFDRREQ